MLDTIGAVFVRVYANTREFERSVRRAADRGGLRFNKMVDGWQKKLRKMGTGGWWDTITTGLAGALGLATKVGGLPFKLMEKLGNGIEFAGTKLAQFGNKFASIFGGVLGPMIAQSSKLMQGLGSSIAALASNPYTAIAAIVAAVGALQVVLSLAVTLASAATAGMVALGSAIYYTVAAAGILVPLIVALGLGFGAMVIGGLDAAKAIGKMNKALNESDPKKRAEAWAEYNKELAKLGPNAREAVKAFKPILESFKGFKRLAGEALFDGMASSLKKAQPFITAIQDGLELMAGAMGNVIDQFLLLGQNQAFLKSLNSLFASSAEILEWLGAAATNFFSGLTGFFSAVAPVAETFAQALARIASSFSDWANSEAGQASITEFFTTAYEMASQVWAIVKELALALHGLFTAEATQAAAEGFLGWILEKIQQFRQFIAEAAADGRLAAWFEQAKQVGIALWGVLSSIGRFLKSMNTPENVAWLVSILNFTRDVIDVMRIMFSVGAWVFNGLFGWVRTLGSAISVLVGWLKKAAEWIGKLKLPSWLPGDWGQGKSGSGARTMSAQLAPIGSSPRSSVVTNYWNITTPSADSRVVASQVMNRAVAMAG